MALSHRFAQIFKSEVLVTLVELKPLEKDVICILHNISYYGTITIPPKHA
jgi:hypothetical protein